MTADQISYRWRTGRWVRVGVRSFVVAGTSTSWEQLLAAGLLDLGQEAVVSHRAAAALLGFEGFPATAIEFTIPRRGGGAECAWRVHTTGTLEQIERDQIGMFRCTSASRTVIDLARMASARELERAIDSAVRDGFSSPSFLRRRLTALRGSGRAGVRLLDELLVDSGGHSDLERTFLRLVRQAGLPRPSCQRIFRRDGRTLARVDFSFEPLPVLAEVSGRHGHSSDAERAKDGRRRNELQHAGFVVLDFTDSQVRRDPTYVIRTLRLHLAPERSWPTMPQGVRRDRP